MMWLIILAFLALIVAAIWLTAYIDYTREARYALLYAPLIVAAWLLGLYAYNRVLDYQGGKCAKWSIETGYKTKFVNIGYGDWDCYGMVDGKWIPINRIRGIEE